jgi:hypothetical protein
MTRTESNRWNPKQKDYNLKKRYHAHPHRELDTNSNRPSPDVPVVSEYIDRPFASKAVDWLLSRVELHSLFSSHYFKAQKRRPTNLPRLHLLAGARCPAADWASCPQPSADQFLSPKK